MATGMTAPDPLQLAIRVYPQPHDDNKRKRRALKHWRRPERMLVFDTECRIDTAQALTFGCYRYYDHGRCLEEGLFYGDDLPVTDRRTLERYAAAHAASSDRRLGRPELQLLTRAQFLEKFYTSAYDSRDLIVGFNLPFDLSRLAVYASAAGDERFAGGFSLAFWEYTGKDGLQHINRYRPRIAIKHIDSKRALKGFTGTFDADPVDLIPEDSETGEPEDGYKFRGHFLDLRSLAFVLTDRGHSLDSACRAFGIEHGKMKVEVHGVVTPLYIDYNRQDVAATAELATRLIAEYDRFDVRLQETQAYSPASLGKAHLRKMGIFPILERQPDFPKLYLGAAETAFFGGRTSAHIRKVPVPVVSTDFLSMYPTVNALMGLWKYVVAAEVSVVHGEVRETTEFLRTISPETLFAPETWTRLSSFVRIIPNGDILPTRAKYSADSNDYQVALNYLYASSESPDDGLWYALPDVGARTPDRTDSQYRGRLPHRAERAARRAPADYAAWRRSHRSANSGLLQDRHRRTQAAFFQLCVAGRRTQATRQSVESVSQCDQLRHLRGDAARREKRSDGCNMLRLRSETVRVQGQESGTTGRVLLPTTSVTDYIRRSPYAGATRTLRYRSGRNVCDGRHGLHGDRRYRIGRPDRVCWRFRTHRQR
jgi:hypothetical protein